MQDVAGSHTRSDRDLGSGAMLGSVLSAGTFIVAGTGSPSAVGSGIISVLRSDGSGSGVGLDDGDGIFFCFSRCKRGSIHLK